MMVKKKSNALIVFAKPPIAGLAKTRLIPALGEAGAASFHGELLTSTLKRVVVLNATEKEWDTHLWCSQDMAHPFFQACLSNFPITLQMQSSGDLGARMAHAMQLMLNDYDNVCIIGADCPVLDADKIREVFTLLKSKNDVVITPAEDGGYVLMAVRQQFYPVIFSGTQWGGTDVFQHTLDNVRALKLNPLIQPTLWDVDTPEDLTRLQAFINAPSP